MRKKLVIYGGGSSAHVLIPFLSRSIFDVSLITSKPGLWEKNIELQYQAPDGKVLEIIHGKLDAVSDAPKSLVPDADYIILCMPVSKYRVALHHIAPYLKRDKKVFIGALYGQGGFNWMVEEIKKEYHLTEVVTFSFGLIPWICRTIEYGKIGVTYGCKAVNVAACTPASYFAQIDEEFFEPICYDWFHTGKVLQSDNFLSLTLSVDNQIIHTSRCYSLYKKYGESWDQLSDVPMFYRDYDEMSAQELLDLDRDYTRIREKIMAVYPEKNFRYMLDYLALERFSYASENTDVRESFVNSKTLVAIKTPVIQNENGAWEIPKEHRFFTDDIYYGLCIVKWIAERLDIEVPTITEILRWAEIVQKEKFLDDSGQLSLDSASLAGEFKSGIPLFYGYKSVEEIVD